MAGYPQHHQKFVKYTIRVKTNDSSYNFLKTPKINKMTVIAIQTYHTGSIVTNEENNVIPIVDIKNIPRAAFDYLKKTIAMNDNHYKMT